MAITAGIAAVATVGSTAYSIHQQDKAAAAQKKAAQVQENQQVSEQRQAKIQAERERRIKAARVIQSAENSGTTGSTGVAGATAQLGTQLASNIAYGNQQTYSAQAIGQYNQQAANAMQDANTAQAVGQLSSTIFTAAGGWESIFSSPTAPTTTTTGSK